MRVVIATAEPFGAYHLTSLSQEMRLRSEVEFLHLIPYPIDTQGTSAATPVVDLKIVDSADCLVITGGGLTPWTHAVAEYARVRRVPVTLIELAYGTAEAQPFAPDRATAMSSSSAKEVAAAFSMPLHDIAVTGNPQLDLLKTRYNAHGPIILVSTSELPARDPSGLLRAIGRELLDRNLPVLVAPHPREDIAYWDGFHFTQAHMSSPSVAIGYPGTVWGVLAAAQVPVIGVGAGTTRERIPQSVLAVASSWVEHYSQWDATLLKGAKPATQSAVDKLCGPVGGAAERILDFILEETFTGAPAQL